MFEKCNIFLKKIKNMFFGSFSILKQFLVNIKNKGGRIMKGVIKKTLLVVAGIAAIFTTVLASGIIYSYIKDMFMMSRPILRWYPQDTIL